MYSDKSANQLVQKFLKALGYLNGRRSDEEEERIQMHADTLYQRMLKEEEEISKAKAEQRAIPTFKPLIPSVATTTEVKITKQSELEKDQPLNETWWQYTKSYARGVLGERTDDASLENATETEREIAKLAAQEERRRGLEAAKTVAGMYREAERKQVEENNGRATMVMEMRKYLRGPKDDDDPKAGK
jgi:hypothetical protein